MKIIVTGSLAFDFIMDFPGKFSDSIMPGKIHEINLSFLVNKLVKQRGGTAGNIAYNLALLGLKPSILATAGYDFDDYKQSFSTSKQSFSTSKQSFTSYKKELDKVGVDSSMIRIIKPEPTASAFIFTDQSDNQITGFYPGAMKEAGKCSIKDVILNYSVIPAKAGIQAHRRCPEFISGYGSPIPYRVNRSGMTKDTFVVISPNDPLAMINLVKECRDLGIDYMFDPGMQLPRLSDQDLKVGIEGAKMVIGNDYEMALISKRLKQFNNVTMKQCSNQIRITTLGEKGARIEVGDTIYSIPPAKPKAVLDPTGAGDAWRAGFLAGFLSGQPLDVCGRMGSVCSVYTVEKYGTQTHKFTKKEFQKRYALSFPRRRESI